jgi:hypothetical protein
MIVLFQPGIPDCMDINQDSDIEIVEALGVRRAQLERVTKLLEYFHPPTHIKGEVSVFPD